MSTKELILQELEHARPEDLEDLYQLIHQFNASKHPPSRSPGVLSRLQEIQIEGPEDFSINLDLYLSGEKSLTRDTHSG